MKIEYNKNTALVVDTGALQVKIKKVLINDIIKGVPKEQTDQKVTKVVDSFLKNIKVKSIKKRYIETISRDYLKWYQFFILSYKTLQSFNKANERLIQTVKGGGVKGFEGVTFNFNSRNYLTSTESETVEISDYRKKTKDALSKIIKQLSKEDLKDASGGTLRNYAEIRIRWEANRDDIGRLKADGVRLVWSSSHANASKRCFPWQGRLYSLDGTSGNVEGHSFIPLEVAMQGTEHNGNGLLGYNCRHRLIPYFTGSTPPKDFTAKEVARAEEIDRKQRYMERKIRKTKEEAFLLRGIDTKHSKELFAKAREQTAEYVKYSEENKRAAYIYRTQVMREEMLI